MGHIKNQDMVVQGKRICYEDENGKELGHAYIYILKNDLHDKPFGLIEDLYVEEFARGQGIGKELLQHMINISQKEGCYKLVANSRKTRPAVHRMYDKVGFKEHGYEFVMRWDISISTITPR